MGKQLRIVGTGRPGIPEALEDASEELVAARREKRRVMKEHNDKVKLAEYKVVTVMQEHSIEDHRIKDPDTDEFLDFELEMVPKIRIHKSGEVASSEGEEHTAPANGNGNPNPSGPHPGLIAQAEAAQAGAAQAAIGVTVNGEGDVVPPDVAAPRKGA